MALDILKCNHLTPLSMKGLNEEDAVVYSRWRSSINDNHTDSGVSE